ncbi:cyclic nucleotide-binding domain-containing protein [Actinomadura fibrosa]|uniref:Cyclic nucleotide-binding domain-containing protein n=1 Tax=Actinomadura fibrosa TaxID=111802 RepID=A0ABW2XEA9_9ACTN|nr:cyclic nucleotide-binding domain-containing protein [Actinomadura fibrosa]
MTDREHRHDPDLLVPAALASGSPAALTPGASGALSERGFWQALTSVEQDALVASADEVEYPIGDVLWREGQTADHVLVILSGWIRVCVERDGSERIIAFRGPGDIIGERAALLLRQRSATIVAMDTVRALRMSTQEFAAYLSDQPRVLAVLEREMYDRLTEQANGAPPAQTYGVPSARLSGRAYGAPLAGQAYGASSAPLSEQAYGASSAPLSEQAYGAPLSGQAYGSSSAPLSEQAYGVPSVSENPPGQAPVAPGFPSPAAPPHTPPGQSATVLPATPYEPSPYVMPSYPVMHPYGPAAQYGPPQRYAGAPPHTTNPHTTNPYATNPYNPYTAQPYTWHPSNPYAGLPPYSTELSSDATWPPHPAASPYHAVVPQHTVPMASGAEPFQQDGTMRHGSAAVGAGPSWAGQNCSILFTDIAGFSDAVHRDDTDRLAVRSAMYGFLRDAFRASRVPWDACHREDRGDGALIVVPPGVPTAAVIDPMIARLAALLRRHNRRSSRAVRIQLRVALHVGPVMPDAEGVAGWPVIHTARLLEARPLKERLAATGADLGFIASSFVYDSVIAHSPGYVDAADYEPVRCRVKESDVRGWMHLLGAPVHPAC